jgi:hypothetical protein
MNESFLWITKEFNKDKKTRVLFGCNSTFEHPAYLNSGKNDVEAYIYWVLGEIIVVHHQKFPQNSINISQNNFSGIT